MVVGSVGSCGGRVLTHLSVGEEKYGVHILHSSDIVEFFKVFVKSGVIVTSTQLDLETAISTNVRAQAVGQDKTKAGVR